MKKLALQYNQVTKGEVGDLPVEIYGGSKQQRNSAHNALKTDLTKGGSAAAEISEALLKNTANGSVKPLEIVLTVKYGSYSGALLGARVLTEICVSLSRQRCEAS